MATFEYPSRSMRIEILEQERDLEIPVLEAVDNKLESLRCAFDVMSTMRDELQAKLDTAVEFSNEQAKLIEQLRGKPSEIEDLKVLLGKATEHANLLSA